MTYKEQKCISCYSGGWKPEIRVPAWSDSGKGSFPDFRVPTSRRVLTWQKRTESSLGPFDKGTTPIHEGSTYDLITVQKPPFLISYWVLGLERTSLKWGSTYFQSITPNYPQMKQKLCEEAISRAGGVGITHVAVIILKLLQHAA